MVELAIVLAIVGLLLGGLLVPLAVQFDTSRNKETTGKLEDVIEALYGFAMMNNRLICPDVDGNGTEDLIGGTCTNQQGVVPWVDLGVSESDAWGQRFTYRVTASFADATDGTACGTATVGVSFELCSNGNMTVLDGFGGSAVANNIPAIVVSHGKNWATATSNDEGENSDVDQTFVDKGFSAAPGAEFDDIVKWISPHVLKNRMVTSAKLP